MTTTTTTHQQTHHNHFRHRLPPPFSTSQSASDPSIPSSIPPPVASAAPLEFIAQGAEAIVYKTCFLTPATPCMLKYRPSKSYRHPTLDRRLTRGRILAEARALVKGRREGLDLPVLYGLDADAGWILTEWIPGQTVRQHLEEHEARNITSDEPEPEPGPEPESDSLSSAPTNDNDNDNHKNNHTNNNNKDTDSLDPLLTLIGRTVGRMHAAGIIHGDLTTSNMMLRPPLIPQTHQIQTPQTPQTPQTSHNASSEATSTGTVVPIDFGLASQTVADEDRAVDLYVLERAFGATHPLAEKSFGVVLEAYGRSYGGGGVVLKRLADVRARGRKKSMVG